MLYNSKESGLISNWIVITVLVVAIFGFADASYIAIKHLNGQIPPCSVLNGCETVLTSKYSSIGPIRLEWLGVFYYLAFIIGAVAYLDSKKPIIFSLLSRFTVVGLLASAVLIGLQVFVIKSYCLYCVMSAITSTVLFVLGMIMLGKLKKPHDTNY
jgi:uncharacterized membrane protein